jgi:hypothetical protein
MMTCSQVSSGTLCQARLKPIKSVETDDEEELGGRRIARPRPWSLIGRKGARSESSSMILQEHYEYGLPEDPDVLPHLFYGSQDVALRSSSPSRLSVKTVFSQRTGGSGILNQLPPTPPDSISSCQSFLLSGKLFAKLY